MQRPVKIPRLYEPHGEIRTVLCLLLPLRLYVGISLIAKSVRKIEMGWLSDPRGFIEVLQPALQSQEHPFGFYQLLLENLIIPQAGLFVYLVIFSEFLIGLFLVIGLLTRLSALLGLLLMVNYYFALPPSLELLNQIGLPQPSTSLAFGFMLLTLLLTGAGRAYGLDHYLQGKLPPPVI